uniref:Uncharacterized protein n=1 Tax=Tetraselmis sp. GSL018 TaxID=582737 RepID=A0A061QXX2_9CHLO|eukprot:CAMPEP_0177606722 /NCGR_PEP_ID=MMETSP0419_2-20121207/17473_1 /TAXON_ID=582737 /ORGANISM="Tetraselmis sp., Strain GSL018" /LENGTH=109 /DNA_ID=CAMNT_0019101131 /DNA_START=183 /DNA_END=512 /DNA_ORIENTATION=-
MTVLDTEPEFQGLTDLFELSDATRRRDALQAHYEYRKNFVSLLNDATEGGHIPLLTSRGADDNILNRVCEEYRSGCSQCSVTLGSREFEAILSQSVSAPFELQSGRSPN